jgi:hypothetical protein
MMLGMVERRSNTAPTMLIAVGLALLGYALLGNYVALPGYLRFLARGGTSAAGNAFDLDVLIGAAKTVVWMYSFQLGVLCLAVARCRRDGLAVMPFVVGGAVWLALWSWPSLPAPGAWFYVTFGSLLLLLIGAVASGIDAPRLRVAPASLRLAAVVFFAFATWEICGLGSTGRMLHPDEAAHPIAHNLLVTQSSKLMIELVIAWSLLWAASRSDAGASRGGTVR